MIESVLICYIVRQNPMFICGTWFCVENRKKKKLKHTQIQNSSPFFGRNNNKPVEVKSRLNLR